jgi:hypothetical protein
VAKGLNKLDPEGKKKWVVVVAKDNEGEGRFVLIQGGFTRYTGIFEVMKAYPITSDGKIDVNGSKTGSSSQVIKFIGNQDRESPWNLGRDPVKGADGAKELLPWLFPDVFSNTRGSRCVAGTDGYAWLDQPEASHAIPLLTSPIKPRAERGKPPAL